MTCPCRRGRSRPWCSPPRGISLSTPGPPNGHVRMASGCLVRVNRAGDGRADQGGIGTVVGARVRPAVSIIARGSSPPAGYPKGGQATGPLCPASALAGQQKSHGAPPTRDVWLASPAADTDHLRIRTRGPQSHLRRAQGLAAASPTIEQVAEAAPQTAIPGATATAQTSTATDRAGGRHSFALRHRPTTSMSASPYGHEPRLRPPRRADRQRYAHIDDHYEQLATHLFTDAAYPLAGAAAIRKQAAQQVAKAVARPLGMYRPGPAHGTACVTDSRLHTRRIKAGTWRFCPGPNRTAQARGLQPGERPW